MFFRTLFQAGVQEQPLYSRMIISLCQHIFQVTHLVHLRHRTVFHQHPGRFVQLLPPGIELLLFPKFHVLRLGLDGIRRQFAPFMPTGQYVQRLLPATGAVGSQHCLRHLLSLLAAWKGEQQQEQRHLRRQFLHLRVQTGTVLAGRAAVHLVVLYV